MKNTVRFLPLFFSFIFFFFALVQYNDPDPLVWMCIYGLACLMSAVVYAGKHSPALLMVLMILYASGAIYQWPEEYEGIMMPMSHSSNIEEARESLGLLICAASMGIYLLLPVLKKKTAVR